MRRGLIGLAALGWLAIAAPAFAQSGPFANWAAIIVAGDWRAHSGAPSPVFDNARRDLARAFVAAGFSSDNVRQFSVHEAVPDGPSKSDPEQIYALMTEAAQRASGGCLIYFTSHGSPDGVVVGDDLWPPAMLAAMVNDACGARPTVIVISACFSGVFVQPLAGPNRMVLTAARPDRASFGCGQSDQYTFFDSCVLAEMPNAHDFVALGAAAQACVQRKEKETGASPPSEPQLDIGVALRPMLPLYAFAKPN